MWVCGVLCGNLFLEVEVGVVVVVVVEQLNSSSVRLRILPP